jgi:moderate conductance mechanosensitive channel
MVRKKLFIILIAIIGITAWVLPVAAEQMPFVQDFSIYSNLLRQVKDDSLNSACIRLDGRCLFKLAATDSELLADRINEIQQRFGEVTADYLADLSHPQQYCRYDIRQDLCRWQLYNTTLRTFIHCYYH